jgi:hypothetical protein
MIITLLAACTLIRTAFDTGRAYQWIRQAKRIMSARTDQYDGS